MNRFSKNVNVETNIANTNMSINKKEMLYPQHFHNKF